MSSARLLSDGIEPSVRAARAHAMKNCVSVILAVSRLAEREVAASSWLRSATLRSAVQRLRELLVEDLAEESAKLAQPRDEAEWCEVEALVRSVTERVEARAADAGVELTASCAGGTIKADAADGGTLRLESNGGSGTAITILLAKRADGRAL